MSHAIFVRRPGDYFDPLPKALATEIPSAGEARRLVRRLARSYTCNGHHRETGVLWFRDADGLVELWEQPE